MRQTGDAAVVWLLLLSTLLTQVLVEAYNPLPKTKVVISNRIEGGPKLMVHCKSDQDDLGVRWLDPGKSFDWSPWSHWFPIGLFLCAFRWEDGPPDVFWFDIYNPQRDDEVCHQLCQWAIRRAWPCRRVPKCVTTGDMESKKYGRELFSFRHTFLI